MPHVAPESCDMLTLQHTARHSLAFLELGLSMSVETNYEKTEEINEITKEQKRNGANCSRKALFFAAVARLPSCNFYLDPP